MILVLINHLELTTESKSTKLSIMRFWGSVRKRECLFWRCTESYLVALFQEHLIVLTQGHILEAMNPLLSLTSLSTYIEHAESLS
jgi:hypothetical protein